MNTKKDIEDISRHLNLEITSTNIIDVLHALAEKLNTYEIAIEEKQKVIDRILQQTLAL